MSTPYVAGLLPQIRAVLETSDLASVSTKVVRKELIRRGQEAATIKANCDSINEHITRIYEELTSTNSAPSPTPSSIDVPLTSSTSYAIPQSSQPEPLRRKTVKRERDVDVKVRVKEETDEEMAARLQREFDTMGNGRASRSGGRPMKRKKVKRKSAVQMGSDGEEVPRRRPGGGSDAFNKELILSDALSELVGEARLSRPQTVKRIWDYVKERGLQDASDRRYILCDEPLQKVFHSDKVHMFTMNKILAKHFMSPEDVIEKPEIIAKDE